MQKVSLHRTPTYLPHPDFSKTKTKWPTNCRAQTPWSFSKPRHSQIHDNYDNVHGREKKNLKSKPRLPAPNFPNTWTTIWSGSHPLPRLCPKHCRIFSSHASKTMPRHQNRQWHRKINEIPIPGHPITWPAKDRAQTPRPSSKPRNVFSRHSTELNSQQLR